jgi:predicted acetyltransferase
MDQANARIAELRKGRVPSRSEREDLDRPVDGQLEVRSTFPRHKLVLVVGGEEVSWLTVVDFRQQIGSGVVRMGGIAGVGTHADHRFQGHARRVMESSLRWMRREGFDTAMLYGIPCFYPKFGYAQAFPGIEFSLAVRDAESVAPAGCRFAAFRAEHLPAVLRMYRRNNVARTGPTLRDPKHWRPFRKGVSYGSKGLCKVALDAGGRPAGYFVYDSAHLSATIIEVGFATTAVFADILRAAARLALRQRLERIKLILPEDDAFVAFCQPLGLRKETTYRPDGGAQVRMIRIASAMAKLAGELGSRMSGTGRLTIRTNLDDVALTWSKSGLSVGPPLRSGLQAHLPQWALAQMLYGYRGAEALAAGGVVKAPRRAVGALEEMFPVRPHFHYLVDHF